MFLVWHFKYLPRPYMILHDKNLTYMPLTLYWVWSSFVTPLRDVSWSQDQNSRTRHQNKQLFLHWEYATHVFHSKNNTPFIYHVPLSQKISYAKKEDMGYAKKKKKKKKNISMPKGMREKNACQRAWRKEEKDSPYFQIKGIHQKERDAWFKEYQKQLELEHYKNSTHLHYFDLGVWCFPLVWSGIWLYNICKVSVPQNIHPKAPHKLIRNRMIKKKAKSQNMPWRRTNYKIWVILYYHSRKKSYLYVFKST
jgi:hypothetical protein